MLISGRQRPELRRVFVQTQALVAGAQVEAFQVIADAAEQRLNQRCAGLGQFAFEWITLLLQGPQDIQRRGRGVQPYPVADTPVTGRVIGEDQRDALLRVGHAGQLNPASRQLRDKVHALGLSAITHHI